MVANKGNLIGKSNRPTQNGLLLKQLLEEHHVEFDSQYSLTDVSWLIRHGISEHKCSFCHCLLHGAKISNLVPYCSMSCYKADPKTGKKISESKKRHYADPIKKAETERKKIKTCIENNGVAFPMQNPVIFERQTKSSKQAYHHRGLDGVRGYECHVIDWLIDVVRLKPDIDFIAGSKARSFLNQRIFVDGHRFPDIYVIPWNTYIEVKGTYTLSMFSRFEAIRDTVEDLGSDYICLLYDRGEIFQIEPHTRNLKPIDQCYRNFIK